MVPISQQRRRQRRYHQGRYGLWWCRFELLNNRRWLGKNGLCSYVDFYGMVELFLVVRFQRRPTRGSSYLLCSLYTVCRSLIDLYETKQERNSKLCSYVDLYGLVDLFLSSGFRRDPLSGSSYLLCSLLTVCRSSFDLYETK